MANPFIIEVKENISELKQIQRQYGELIGKRILMLIVIKKHQDKGGISKRALSEKTGINHNSIVKWRKMYLKGGLASLLVHGRIGFKKPILTPEQHKSIENKLNTPNNGLQGYVEIQRWVKEELGIDMAYTTLLQYVQKHFGTKIKVARKSHIKKDAEAVESFKKTLVKK